MSAPIITVSTVVKAPIDRVWNAWTLPEHITKWNAASDDWHSPSATNDLRVGGRFKCRMEARDGSAGFDFEGTYTRVEPQRQIAYAMDDGREVSMRFEPVDGGTKVSESFRAETENPVEMQKAGWQSILDNFRKHAEALA
jgi:uncharacterized protein YndB with AHSA1/START domain